MPLFEYKALTTSGKNTKGMIEAESQKAARFKLKKQGLMVVDVVEKNAGRTQNNASPGLFSGKASIKDVALMTRQLASLIKANIPLVEALNAMVEQLEHPTLKVTIAGIRQDVNEGMSLAKAFAKHPKVFDITSINMVEAGESSGALGTVLLRLADLKESQMRLRQKISSAMTYPILMISVASLMMIGLFTVVIPKMAETFKDMGRPLPPITQAMIQISDFISSYWYLIIGGAVFGASTFSRYIKSKEGKPKWDAFVLTLPVFGPLSRMIAVTRFAHTMGTLLSSGVPILSAMNIAKNLVDNGPISKAIGTARENITEGQSIADPLKRSGEFPPMVIHMIAIGEKTGELPEMLLNVANTYEDQVKTRVEGMTALIEPVMIIFMGGMVGMIVVSIFMPLLDMGNIQR